MCSGWLPPVGAVLYAGGMEQSSIERQLRRCVLPLMAVTGEARWVGIGTAFVVGVADDGKTGLLLTAAHNLLGATTLDPYLRRGEHASLPNDFARAAPQPRLGSTKMYCLTAGGTPARMDYAWWNAGTDIAFLSVTLPENSPDRLDMRLPIDSRREIAEGTPVIALGFPQLESSFSEPPDYEAGHFVVEVCSRLDARPGTVIRTVQADDAGSHTGIGLLVTCPIDAGMSGGPVIEERENRIIVRAVSSRSLSTEERGSQGSSDHAFAGLLMPAVAIRANELTLDTASHGYIKGPTVLELIREGAIEDIGRAHEWVRLV